MNDTRADLASYWQRASDFVRAGDYANAIMTYRTIVERHPDEPMGWFALSSAAWAGGDFRMAVEHARSAALAMREFHRFDGLPDLAQHLQNLGETRFATHIIERAGWSLVSSHPELAARLAQTLGQAGSHAEALQLLDLALTRHQPTPLLSYMRAMTLRHLGRGNEATTEFERCLALAPTYPAAMLMLATHDAHADAAGQLARIDAALARGEPDPQQQAMLEYARFIHLDAAGDTTGAWAALAAGMQLKRAQLDHDAGAEQARFDALAALCDEAFVSRADGADDAGHVPIFVFGMPRTGTTVLERLLANHSQVASAGELNEFHHQLCWEANLATAEFVDPRLLAAATTLDFSALGHGYLQRTEWRRGGASHLIDKLPRNFLHAGLIRRALPQARLICLVRDPLDSCLSNLKELFAGTFYPYSYDPLETAHHVLRFRALLAHWERVMPGTILAVCYEELVRDPASVMRKVLAHCGLPFEAACTDLAHNVAPSSTASSSQVRQQLHARAVGAWRRYAQPLAAAEALLRQRLPAAAFSADRGGD